MPTLRVISAHQATDGVVQPQLCYLSEVIGQPFTPLAFTLLGPYAAVATGPAQQTTARAICRGGKMAPFSRLSTLHRCAVQLCVGVKSRRLYSVPFPNPNTFEDP